MKVSELTGAELDYWVAQCELTSTLDGLLIHEAGNKRWTIVDAEDGSIFGLICDGIIARSKARRELSLPQNVFYYWPSVDWAYGGPLIERHRKQIAKYVVGQGLDFAFFFATATLADFMRVVVASVYSEEVPEIAQ